MEDLNESFTSVSLSELSRENERLVKRQLKMTSSSESSAEIEKLPLPKTSIQVQAPRFPLMLLQGRNKENKRKV